jgi:hypothetical protein
MNFALTFKDFMGALAVAMTLVACGIYVWQTLRGRAGDLCAATAGLTSVLCPRRGPQ